MPGRAAEIRRPTDAELAATLVLALPIARVVAEGVRRLAGGPGRGRRRSAWAGVLPMITGYGAPVPRPTCGTASRCPSRSAASTAAPTSSELGYGPGYLPCQPGRGSAARRGPGSRIRSICSASADLIIVMPLTMRITSRKSVSGRDDLSGLLRPLEQRLAGLRRSRRGTCGRPRTPCRRWPSSRSRAPAWSRRSRRSGAASATRASHGGRSPRSSADAAQRLDLFDVDRFEQVLPGRESAGRACRCRPRPARAMSSSEASAPCSANALRAASISLS